MKKLNTGTISFLVIFIFVAATSIYAKVESKTLNKDTKYKIQGKKVLFKKGYVILNNGTPTAGVLAKDTEFTLNKKSFILKGGQGITFHNNGTLSGGTLKGDTLFQLKGKDIPLKGGTKIAFHENGSLHSCRLSKVTIFTIQGKPVPLKYVEFSKSGKPVGGRLIKPAFFKVQGRNIKFDKNKFSFHENGAFKSGRLYKETPVKIQGRYLKCKGHISFFPNGIPSNVTLVRPARLRTTGTWKGALPFLNLEFDESGLVIERQSWRYGGKGGM